MAKRKHIEHPSHKARLKIGTQVEFSFAGETLTGKIEAIETDNAYSQITEWYKIKHTNGTIYPLQTDNTTIKAI
jgi:hypothetical protein